MSKKFLDTDVYSKSGILLLSKGQELSNTMVKKLEAVNYITMAAITQKENLQREQDIANKAKQMQEKLKSKKTLFFDSSAKIVTNLIFKSKTQPWWFYVNTLSNYGDWLYTHCIDVALLSTMAADALNLNNDIEDIALGAFLHDVGKLMIPRSIIEKPRKLTTEEYFYIHQHCDLGISMVKDFHLPQISLDIIDQHHERLDGSGYPNELTGAEIPIHSRIVMIADILDAITAYRPYKSEREMQSAINELRTDSAKYPQEILDVFSTFFS